jgi:hypothetical protein
MVILSPDLVGCPALPVFSELFAAGVRFRLDGDSVLVSPGDAVTPEHREVLQQHRDAVRVLVATATDEGVMARWNAFKIAFDATPPPRTPVFVFREGVPYACGTCFSCADELPEPRFGRCWRCSLAWRLVCRLPVLSELPAQIGMVRRIA